MAIALLFLISTIGSATATPIEITASQRCSVRSYTDQPVTFQQLLTTLNYAYGYLGNDRVLPSIGNAYRLTVFVVNSSGSYLYTPETNSVSVSTKHFFV